MTPSKRRRSAVAAWDQACRAATAASDARNAIGHWAFGPGAGPSPAKRRAALLAIGRARKALDRLEAMVMRLECDGVRRHHELGV